MRILPLLATLLIAAPALAQDRDAPPPDPSLQPVQASVMAEPVAMMIAAFDRDGDARVSRAELGAGVMASFAAIDRGNAGSLGYIAFADWAERWLGDRAALPSPFEVDADGDNRITLSELTARFETIFTRLDKDKDGVLTRAELLTIRTPTLPPPNSRERAREREAMQQRRR